jgi:RHS repeat-associated protein
VTNSYDPADNRTLMQDSLGGTTTYVLDALNRLATMQFSGNSATLREDFSYTARDQVANQTRYSNLAGTSTIGYSGFTQDSVGRLTNLVHQNGTGTTLAYFTNTYDLASRITSEILNGGTPTSYAYDTTDELTSDAVNSYSYDLNGNRTMTGYTTGPANEMTSDGTWDYFFDKNGNVIAKTNISTGEAWTFSYDNRNRLISALDVTTGLQMQATYVYDARGKRIEKDVWTQTSGSTTTTRFGYDGDEIWADLTSANALQMRYLRGSEVLELLARVSSGGTAAWMLADRMGSVRQVVDSTGAVIDTITFDGSGNVTNETNAANGGSYKAFGYRLDSETGWLRPDPSAGRYYDPASGRWMQMDPLGFWAGDSDLFRYVGNNPTDFY